MTSPDPTSQNHWAPLRRLLADMDEEIGRLYAERGVDGVRPRFAKPLIKLARLGPLTIGELAEVIGGTHSATSQTVAAMRKEKLVQSAPGRDARTRTITLTDRGRDLVPFLEREWRATEMAVAELDSEVPYSMLRVVADLERALATRSFAERIGAHLEADGGAQG